MSRTRREWSREWVAAGSLVLLAACASRPPQQGGLVPVPPPDRDVTRLEAALKSADPAERAAAAWQLAGAGSVPDAVRAQLRAATGDADERVRLAAAWALGHLRAAAGGAAATPTPPDFDTPPRMVHQTRPVYPQDAFDQKVQGVVEVEMLIGERGEVAHAEVRRSIPLLDAAALAAVRGWRFSPATREGRPVPVLVVSPVTFRIY